MVSVPILKYKLTIEYDGTNYHGWQKQPGLKTIQAVIEHGLQILLGEKTSVISASRTDAGVHALGQVAHFKTRRKLTPFAVLRGLNSLLPDDIVIVRVEQVTADFHSQFDAKSKVYRYTVLNRQYSSALGRHYVFFMPGRVNVASMRKAAKYLTGRHDFSSFTAAGTVRSSFVRKITRLTIGKTGDFLVFTVEGNGFLKGMVRIIVGTLLEVGRGRRKPESIKEILKARRRTASGATAPGRGLCLVKVKY